MKPKESLDSYFKKTTKNIKDYVPQNINPANIVCLTRISNYLEKNMPMILLHMNLDKNVFDKLLQNAKTATIHLNISKYDAGYTYDEAFYDAEGVYGGIVEWDWDNAGSYDYPDD